MLQIIDESLKICWKDDHLSMFELSWLYQINFSPSNIAAYVDNFYQPKKLLWSKNNFTDVFKSFDYHLVLSDDVALLKWLQTLAVRGIAVLKNTPANEDEIYKLANRVSFVRKTHFGNHFVVKAKTETSTFAYTPATLQLHTDIPYYRKILTISLKSNEPFIFTEHMPSINLLHCLVQSKSSGGENLVTDGFFVAEILRRDYPDYFQILSRVRVNWCDIGNEDGNSYHYLLRAPVIW